jgi:NADH-quinone oxidoreductase subunit C
MHPKPPPPPMSTTPWECDLTLRLSQQFSADISGFSSYLGQEFLVAAVAAVVPILRYLRDEENFDFLVDLTALDYPDRPDRFELIYIVYSFSANRRIRVKTRLADAYQPETATGIYLSANWLEREVFDMFGIEFAGHPDMRRILLPEDWTGYPLRKDYGILQMDNRWVRENLGIESGQ